MWQLATYNTDASPNRSKGEFQHPVCCMLLGLAVVSVFGRFTSTLCMLMLYEDGPPEYQL